MRLVVGYLATPSGTDGVTLGIRLARSLNARLELCMVIPPDRPHHHLAGDDRAVRAVRAVRERAVTHAQVLDEARAQLQGDGLATTAQVADGDSVESAVRTLEWHEGDIVLVGSSRLAQHHRLFLGSTAAKMLRVVPVPMVVVPNSDGHLDD